VRTLLVDGDLREPHTEDFIKPRTPLLGLKQCISEEERPNDVIQNEVLPDLSVLYAGGSADNAQELLAGEPFKRLIERCLRDFEFTIIDTPPADRCADGLRISTLMGYALVVARTNVSRVNELSALAAELQADGAQVIGTVLNEV
jgi:Mrp family chromosome partitioning ATPase